MLNKIYNKAEYLIKTSKLLNLEAYKEERQELDGRHPAYDNKRHLAEAIDWLKRAQDATPDSGVARGYSVAWDPYFRRKGWQASYPETTGYIIPTFYECSKYLGDSELSERAEKMAKWEIDIQMENGAVRGGTYNNEKPVASIFCTGQVIFGWAHTYRETGNKDYLHAVKRAGDFLLSTQNGEGKLVEDPTYNFADKDSTVYHSRVAWSLVLLGKVSEEIKYTEAGIKNIEHALQHQDDNGWFRNNCLSDPGRPLLHTICYAMRGILESGILLDDKKYINAAKLAADSLLEVTSRNSYIPGRLNNKWESDVKWSCVTGEAQLAIIFLRLFQITQDERYLKGAGKLIKFVKTTQNCTANNPGIRGGIKGSYPISGGYGTFQILNWATKFFADALLIDNLINEKQAYISYG